MNRTRIYRSDCQISTYEINKIISKIDDNLIDEEWSITDAIEFFNIFKYLNEKKVIIEIENITNINEYQKKINMKIGKFLKNYQNKMPCLFDELNYYNYDSLFDVLCSFNYHNYITEKQFKIFIQTKNVNFNQILKYDKLVKKFDKQIKDVLLENSINAEVIINKCIENHKNDLPSSLKDEEIFNIISKYLDNKEININYIRKLISAPPYFKIPNELKLKAIKKERSEVDLLIKEGPMNYRDYFFKIIEDESKVPIKESFGISYYRKDFYLSWFNKNKNYVTLWNNFIIACNFLDKDYLLNLCSFNAENCITDIICMPKADFLYPINFIFQEKEIISNLCFKTYLEVLREIGISHESLLHWFFNSCLPLTFNINNFIFNIPPDNNSYQQKCTLYLIELERILKQYTLFAKNNKIDQELLQVSSEIPEVKSLNIPSLNIKKYVYCSSEWIQKIIFLLFNDQSLLSCLKNDNTIYTNFYELILSGISKKTDFDNFPNNPLDWLITNKIIGINAENYLTIINPHEVNIFYKLYKKEVISYWHCNHEEQNIINKFYEKKYVKFEDSLFSNSEKEYFQYYLNRKKYSNGFEIRNMFIHASNNNKEEVCKDNYYLTLELIDIIILKIYDDLSIYSKCQNSNKSDTF